MASLVTDGACYLNLDKCFTGYLSAHMFQGIHIGAAHDLYVQILIYVCIHTCTRVHMYTTTTETHKRCREHRRDVENSPLRDPPGLCFDLHLHMLSERKLCDELNGKGESLHPKHDMPGKWP